MTGVCINGKCLCVGDKDCGVRPSNARLLLEEEEPTKKALRIAEAMECPIGEIFDPISRACLSCSEWLFCEKCNSQGCVECDDGSEPIKGSCHG